MKVLRYPKTAPVCPARGCGEVMQVEFVTGPPEFTVWMRIHCGCGRTDENGELHEDDVLLLVGALAIKSHNRKG
ncbi:MAG: hypothetical protein WDO72_14365 [Pseudomonadota bacterium]